MRPIRPLVLFVALLGGVGLVTAGPADAAPHHGRVTASVHPVGRLTAGRAGRLALHASRSHATVTGYRLDFGDHSAAVIGRHLSSRQVRHTFARSGWHTVTLTVTAKHAKTAVRHQRVLVLSPKAKPVAKVVVHPSGTAVANASTVTSFSPGSGVAGTIVTINGSGFTSPATVTFNSASAYIASVTTTAIRTVVPPAATTGPLTVTSAGTTTQAGTFTVPVGILANTVVGPPGTTVSQFFGSGFAPNEPVDLYVGTVSVGFVAANAQGGFQTTVTIPSTTLPGVVQLGAVGRKSLVAAQTSFTVRTDWAQIGGGNFHTAYNPYENTLGTGTVGGLGTAWTVTASPGFYGSPSVVGGVVYALDESSTLHTYNAATGAAGWTYAASGYGYGTPTVTANGIYFSTDSATYALTTAGALKWSVSAAAAAYANPVVSGNIVYVNSAFGVTALNATTGATVWSVSAAGSLSAPTVVDGMVVVGGTDDKVSAYNAASGSLLWSYTAGDYVDGSPAYANGVFYVGSNDHKVYALNASTGALEWSYTAGDAVVPSVAVGNGVVSAASRDGRIQALDANRGSLLWSVIPVGANYQASGGLSLANGVLYGALYNDSGFYALNASSGALLWQARTRGAPYDYDPVVVNGVFYGTAASGSLTAYTLAGGQRNG